MRKPFGMTQVACLAVAIFSAASVEADEPVPKCPAGLDFCFESEECCPLQALLGKMLLKVKKTNGVPSNGPEGVISISFSTDAEDACDKKAGQAAKCCAAEKCTEGKKCDAKTCSEKSCADKGCCEAKECCQSKSCCESKAACKGGECTKESVGVAHVKAIQGHPMFGGGMMVISSSAPGVSVPWTMVAAPAGRPVSAHLPDDMQVNIQKKGHQPARITVKQGVKSWSTTENELEMLPPESRMTVMRMLGKSPEAIHHAMPHGRTEMHPMVVLPHGVPAVVRGEVRPAPEGRHIEIRKIEPEHRNGREVHREHAERAAIEEKATRRIRELEQMVERLRHELEARRAQTDKNRNAL